MVIYGYMSVEIPEGWVPIPVKDAETVEDLRSLAPQLRMTDVELATECIKTGLIAVVAEEREDAFFLERDTSGIDREIYVTQGLDFFTNHHYRI